MGLTGYGVFGIDSCALVGPTFEERIRTLASVYQPIFLAQKLGKVIKKSATIVLDTVVRFRVVQFSLSLNVSRGGSSAKQFFEKAHTF